MGEQPKVQQGQRQHAAGGSPDSPDHAQDRSNPLQKLDEDFARKLRQGQDKQKRPRDNDFDWANNRIRLSLMASVR